MFSAGELLSNTSDNFPCVSSDGPSCSQDILSGPIRKMDSDCLKLNAKCKSMVVASCDGGVYTTVVVGVENLSGLRSSKICEKNPAGLAVLSGLRRGPSNASSFLCGLRKSDS